MSFYYTMIFRISQPFFYTVQSASFYGILFEKDVIVCVLPIVRIAAKN